MDKLKCYHCSRTFSGYQKLIEHLIQKHVDELLDSHSTVVSG